MLLTVTGFRCPGPAPRVQVSDASAGSSSGGSAGTDTTGGSGGGGASGGVAGAGGLVAGSGGAGGAGGAPCDTGPDTDDDLDGFTNNQGDCDDCNPDANPQAVEMPTPQGDTPVNEDCDADTDEPPETCDSTLQLGSTDPLDGARAIDLCRQSQGADDWGIVSVAWTRADGTAVPSPSFTVGLSDAFGTNILPQLGSRMLVLSTGHARDADDDPDPCGADSCTLLGEGVSPGGFPQVFGSCATGTTIHDDIALEVTLRVPSNAFGFSLRHAFASFEFPEFVCTQYNDQFVALMSPAPANAVNGNVAFDSSTTPPSVLFEIFDHCDPTQAGQYACNCPIDCPMPPDPYCAAGTTLLDGTGFNSWGAAGFGSGSTGWLETTVAVNPDDPFTLRLTVFDVGDVNVDSTAWVDAFQWQRDGPATPQTVAAGPPS